MRDVQPIGIENMGNSCFLNALVQCLCIPAATDNIRENMAHSTDPLDILVNFVATRPLDRQIVGPENTRDFGQIVPYRRGLARECALQIDTPLIREIFGTEIGLQGQQCPLQFFSAACKDDGIIASCFNASVGEVLKCGECGTALTTPHSWSDNYVQILKFDNDTVAVTLKNLILENIISSQIQDYRPAAHCNSRSSTEPCAARHGAYHVTYFSQRLPRHLCFALSSRTEEYSNNTRHFAPEHHMTLAEIASYGNDTPRMVQYELYATITHSGQGRHGGHFSAYVMHAHRLWFHFDDEHVQAEDAETVINPPMHQAIYMLFYRRTTV